MHIIRAKHKNSMKYDLRLPAAGILFLGPAVFADIVKGPCPGNFKLSGQQPLLFYFISIYLFYVCFLALGNQLLQSIQRFVGKLVITFLLCCEAFYRVHTVLHSVL